YGEDLLESWTSDAACIQRWIQQGPGEGHPLLQQWEVSLTPAHGDLNKSNALFWVENEQPFLIDFTTFQKKGHVLQDLAHLEAEVLLLLMDREHNPQLPGRDLTHEQLRFWYKAAGHLASEQWQDDLHFAEDRASGVVRAVALIRKVRASAV